MKITLRELTDAQGSLMKVLSKELDDFKLAYRLRRLADKFLSELKHFDKLRQDKVKELGEKDEKTHNFKVKPENVKHFQDELNKVMDEEVDLDISLIPLNFLETSGIKLSALDLSFLDKFIDHEAVKPDKPKGKGDISNQPPSDIPNKE